MSDERNQTTRPFIEPARERYVGSALVAAALVMWTFGQTSPAFVAGMGFFYWAVATVGWLMQRRSTRKNILHV